MQTMKPPTLLPSPEDRIIISVEYPNITPELLFDYFVRPPLIQRWWAPHAETNARQGGLFHFAWKDMNLHLRGQYSMVERGARLAFTWQWDAERTHSRPPRQVSLTFEPCADGTRLHILHMPYGSTAPDQSDRKNHGEAWCFFLARLQSLITKHHPDSAAAAAH
jgi:uncharacterized protein YndB with AHSA1/START domain